MRYPIAGAIGRTEIYKVIIITAEVLSHGIVAVAGSTPRAHELLMGSVRSPRGRIKHGCWFVDVVESLVEGGLVGSPVGKFRQTGPDSGCSRSGQSAQEKILTTVLRTGRC